jgi:hypothetical protein
MKNLNPNPDDALQYLELLAPGEDEFTFQAFDDSANKDRNKAKVFHGTLEQHAASLIRLNQNGAGIFVMVNKGDGIAHAGKKSCRCNDNIIAVRAMFVDADGAPLEPILAESPLPHIVVESSPERWHVYWRTSDTKLDEFKPRQQALAERFSTDPSVCDLARVMRLPGFFHHKSEPFMTRLVNN